MREWLDPINPFNWMKVLWWKENLLGSLKNKLLPPVQADTNPTNMCDYNCIWCNSKEFRHREPKVLSREHLYNLADLYKSWGVKATCVAGGGEPLLNPATYPFLIKLKENRIETGLITNGYWMKEFEVIAFNTKWCGFSLDAGTKETYARLKGVKEERFVKVVQNIRNLAKVGGPTRIAVKFLMHPENIYEISDACDIAKDSGATDFQVRPVGMTNLYPGWKNQELDYDIDLINEELANCFDMEDENFHVYGIKHKFNPTLNKKNGFSKCYCTPLLACFCADGYCYLCFDRRGMERMCKHSEIREFWGSKEHLKMIDNIDPKTCPRCTYGPHNEFVEKGIIKDGLCINFP